MKGENGEQCYIPSSCQLGSHLAPGPPGPETSGCLLGKPWCPLGAARGSGGQNPDKEEPQKQIHEK